MSSDLSPKQIEEAELPKDTVAASELESESVKAAELDKSAQNELDGMEPPKPPRCPAFHQKIRHGESDGDGEQHAEAAYKEGHSTQYDSMPSSNSIPNTPAHTPAHTPASGEEHPAAAAAADVAPDSAQEQLQDLDHEAEATDSDKSPDKEQVEGTHVDPTKMGGSTDTDADEIGLMEPPKPVHLAARPRGRYQGTPQTPQSQSLRRSDSGDNPALIRPEIDGHIIRNRTSVEHAPHHATAKRLFCISKDGDSEDPYSTKTYAHFCSNFVRALIDHGYRTETKRFRPRGPKDVKSSGNQGHGHGHGGSGKPKKGMAEQGSTSTSEA
ncbi:hypothetical protein DFH09DRAFT_1110010 [Mycena vulgaris]|nr:hypothetical protein DFH09DRAFT_1110010 [Mycena vulgaris]